MKIPTWKELFGLFARVARTGGWFWRARGVVGLGVGDANSLVHWVAKLGKAV